MSASVWTEWQYLRTKADETTDDPDWIATNDPEAGSIDFTSADYTTPPNDGVQTFTDIEFVIWGTDANRAIQDPAAMTLTVELVQSISRTSVARGGAEGLEAGLADSAAITGVELSKLYRIPCNGGTWTIRITSDAGDAVDNLEVWFHLVTGAS